MAVILGVMMGEMLVALLLDGMFLTVHDRIACIRIDFLRYFG